MFFDETVSSNTSLIKCVCNNCHTSFYTSTNNQFEQCFHCGNAITRESTLLSNEFNVVPFTQSFEDALRLYKKRVKKSSFIPHKFKKNRNIFRLYLPAIFVNAKANGLVSFIAGDKEEIVKNREKYIEVKKYKVDNDINFDYKNVLLPNFSFINEKIFAKVCKYDFRNLVNYDEEIFRDSFMIDTNQSLNELSILIREKIMDYSMKICRDNIQHKLSKIDNNNVNIIVSTNKEVLLPVYFLVNIYKGKPYYFLMNGQNKEVYFDSTYSKLSVFLFGGFLFIIIFVLSFLVSYYL